MNGNVLTGSASSYSPDFTGPGAASGFLVVKTRRQLLGFWTQSTFENAGDSALVLAVLLIAGDLVRAASHDVPNPMTA